MLEEHPLFLSLPAPARKSLLLCLEGRERRTFTEAELLRLRGIGYKSLTLCKAMDLVGPYNPTKEEEDKWRGYTNTNSESKRNFIRKKIIRCVRAIELHERCLAKAKEKLPLLRAEFAKVPPPV